MPRLFSGGIVVGGDPIDMLNTVNTFNHGRTLHMLIGELLLISRQKQEYQAPITNDEKKSNLVPKNHGKIC